LVLDIWIIFLNYININPSPDQQLNLLGIVPEQVGHLFQLSIVLNPKQNIESIENDTIMQTCKILCIKMHQHKSTVRQLKG